MNVEIYHNATTPCPQQVVGAVAGICVGKGEKEGDFDRRLKHLLESGHHSPLRWANVALTFTGVSRVTTHQIVRHANLAYMQRSQRYVNEAKSDVIIPETILANPDALMIYGSHIDNTRAIYRELIEVGVPKQDARYALLNGWVSAIDIVGNYQAWLTFLWGESGRLQEKAQWEIRAAAEMAHKRLNELAPIIVPKQRPDWFQTRIKGDPENGRS